MRGASMAKNFGLDVQVISTGEIKERLPHYNMENVAGRRLPARRTDRSIRST